MADGIRYVSARDGHLLGIRRFGSPDARPLLVLPGGPCRDPSYLGDLAGLAEEQSAVVFHPRGTPMTGGLSNGWWQDADDVIDVADGLGWDSFDLIAHSAGTRLALAVVAQHHDRVQSVALITPPAAWLTDVEYDGAVLAAARAEPEIAEALTSMAGPEPANDDAFQRSWEHENPAGYARWTDRERAHARIGAMTLDAATSWFRDIPSDVAQRILAVPMPPTLVVAGALDILTGVAPVVAYAAMLKGELVMLADSGHYPWVEQPEAFRRALAPWMRSSF